MFHCWTTIRVSDLNRSIRFYTDVVGLEPMERLGTESHRVIMFGADGTTKLELINEDDPLPEGLGKGVTIGFMPSDLDAYMDGLRAMGIPIIGPFVADETVRFCFITDPDGYRIQFVEKK